MTDDERKAWDEIVHDATGAAWERGIGWAKAILAADAELKRLREENDSLSSHVDEMNKEMNRMELFMKEIYTQEIVSTPTTGAVYTRKVWDAYKDRHAGKEG